MCADAAERTTPPPQDEETSRQWEIGTGYINSRLFVSAQDTPAPIPLRIRQPPATPDEPRRCTALGMPRDAGETRKPRKFR